MIKYSYIFLCFSGVVLFLLSCAESKVNVAVPQASSKELSVRSEDYERTMRKHSFDNKNDPGRPIHNSEIYEYATAYSRDQQLDLTTLMTLSNQKRLALVVGNSNYIKGARLANPINDARAMASVLNELGFEVITLEDASQADMKKTIDDFGNKLVGYDVSLFFYAGHGVQVKGHNYLVPIDANISSENDVEYNCVQAGRVLSKMEDAGCQTNIIILDACRDNPFERSWTRDIGVHGKGLAFMSAPSGSIIAYSTSPGKTASDGLMGTNGVYTAALLEQLQIPNISIEETFKRVRITVENRTNKVQIPWESTSLKGSFVFKINATEDKVER